MALFKINGQDLEVEFPPDIEVLPFDTSEGFKTSARGGILANTVVIHNSAGTNPSVNPGSGVVETLWKGGNGVHFVVGPVKGAPHKAVVRQYADPVADQVSHTSGINQRAVGIEAVGPVVSTVRGAEKISNWWPRSVPQHPLFNHWVPSTPGQCEAVFRLWSLMRALSISGTSNRLMEVPDTICGLRGNSYSFRGIMNSEAVGLVAHAQVFSGHSDGFFEQLYCGARLRTQDPVVAYNAAFRSVAEQSQQKRDWVLDTMYATATGSMQQYALTRSQIGAVATSRYLKSGPVFTQPQDAEPMRLVPGEMSGADNARERGVYVASSRLTMYDFAQGRWVLPAGSTLPQRPEPIPAGGQNIP
jgi:hypothetical protein